MKNEVEKNGLNSVEDGDLEKISGGYVYRDRSKTTHQYEVIDDVDGEVLVRCSSLEEAKRLANKLGQSEKKIRYKTLDRIRHNDDTRYKIETVNDDL